MDAMHAQASAVLMCVCVRVHVRAHARGQLTDFARRLLIRLDLPELVRPTTAISGTCMWLRRSSRSCSETTRKMIGFARARQSYSVGSRKDLESTEKGGLGAEEKKACGKARPLPLRTTHTRTCTSRLLRRVASNLTLLCLLMAYFGRLLWPAW